jgi:hypothetical protein
MDTVAVVGIIVGAIVVIALIVVLVQKMIAHRADAKSAQIKDRLRRKTKPLPITGPRAVTPRTTED